jgi:hypothetical protein
MIKVGDGIIKEQADGSLAFEPATAASNEKKRSIAGELGNTKTKLLYLKPRQRLVFSGFLVPGDSVLLNELTGRKSCGKNEQLIVTAFIDCQDRILSAGFMVQDKLHPGAGLPEYYKYSGLQNNGVIFNGGSSVYPDFVCEGVRAGIGAQLSRRFSSVSDRLLRTPSVEERIDSGVMLQSFIEERYGSSALSSEQWQEIWERTGNPAGKNGFLAACRDGIYRFSTAEYRPEFMFGMKMSEKDIFLSALRRQEEIFHDASVKLSFLSDIQPVSLSEIRSVPVGRALDFASCAAQEKEIGK